MTVDAQLPMVGWYDPAHLARTGIEVAISTVFGRHSDHRLVEALAASQRESYDYACHYREDEHDLCEPDSERPRESIWIDYVSDVGDGWNSTYTIAYYLAEAARTFTYTDETGKQCRDETRHGDLLIFGGDLVYPTASRLSYEQRLLAPYRTALRRTEHPPYPHLFAIPGNHDWYDSLVSFTRLFTAQRWFGGWRTRQSRSYFALKLPHGWWLLGTDVQLGSDIDRPQVEYFEGIAKQLQAGDRIILCHAEPHWIYANMYEELDANYSESNLAFLEKKLGKKVAVFIAGDLHHYRRHQATDGSFTQKITAGGGGAFLHPTHTGHHGKDLKDLVEKVSVADGKRVVRTFRHMKSFPEEAESEQLGWQNLYFPYLKGNASWTFGFATAILYWLTTLALVSDIKHFERPGSEDGGLIAQITGAALDSISGSPLTLFWVLLTLLGFVLFTDTHSRRYRLIMGPLHGLAHVLAAFAIAVVAIEFVVALTSPAWVLSILWGGYEFHPDLRALPASLLILLGGFIVGPFIMGLYLLISLNYFGRHSTEAFSSLAIQDWKHFLRLHIDAKGDLTIYPIGIRRVPRAWKARTGTTGPELVPDRQADLDATEPELIEPPIVLRPAATPTGVTVAPRSPQP